MTIYTPIILYKILVQIYNCMYQVTVQTDIIMYILMKSELHYVPHDNCKYI